MLMTDDRQQIAAAALAEINRRHRESRRFIAEPSQPYQASIELPGAAMPDPSRVWFAIRTNPKSERRAALGLSRKGISSFIPQSTRLVAKKGGGKELRLSPLFPRYCFVGFPDVPRFWLLRGVDGLESLVRGADHKPAEIPPAALLALWDAQAAGAFDERRKALPTFQPGDKVSGPWGDFAGEVARAKPGKRVEVLLSAFGGSVKVRVKPEQLRAAE